MSDYLSNLTARSLSLAAVIQPRLASLFEPQQGIGGLFSAPRFPSEPPDLESEPERDESDTWPPATPAPRSPDAMVWPGIGVPIQPPRSPAAQPAPEPAAPQPGEVNPTPPRPPVPGREPVQPPAQPHIPADTSARPPGADQAARAPVSPLAEAGGRSQRSAGPVARPAPGPPGAHPETFPTQAAPHPPASRPVARRVEPPDLDRPLLAPAGQPVARRVEPPDLDRPLLAPAGAGAEAGAAFARSAAQGRSAPEPASRHMVVERVVEPAAVHPLAAPGPAQPPVQPARRAPAPAIVAQPRVTKYVERAAPAPEPPQPAPTIQVTIGRIEVRATAPPPAPRSPAPQRPGPALSLEEYLKQRNGGQR